MEKNLSVQNQKSLENKQPTFSVYMERNDVRAAISRACGKNAQSFIASVISAVSTNPALAECKQSTILSAALLGESLKLSPSPQLGQYYMVPFKDKRKGPVAQFILGYKGYIQLAIRSGQYRKLNALPIKKGEFVSYDPLNEEIVVNLITDENERENAETIGYYAMFEYINGFRKAIYWSKEKMLLHADRYSKAFSAKAYADLLAGKIPEDDMWKYSSFWYKDFDGMALKTMLRQLISKWGVMTVDMTRALESDEMIISENGGGITVSDEPTEAVEQAQTDETSDDSQPNSQPDNQPSLAGQADDAAGDDEFSENDFFS